MALPLAHGSGIELIPWLAWLLVLLAAYLVAVAIASLLAGLLIGTVLLWVVRRGRYLLVLLPIVIVALFLLLDPAGNVSGWINQPFLTHGVLRTSGAIIAGLCGLISAAFLASARRAVRRSTSVAAVAAVEPSPWAAQSISSVPVASVPQSKSADFHEGLQAPLEGLRYLIAHPELWRYALLPIVLNVLITAVVLFVLIGAGAWFALQLHPKFSPTWWGVILEILAGAGILVVALALAAITWLVLNGILCGHFYAKLAKRVELQLGTPPEALRDVPLRYQIVDTLLNLGALIAVTIGLLLLNIIPLIGSIAAVVLGVYLDGFIFGADQLDYPMSLRGLRRRQQRDLCCAHRWQTVGLGAAVFAFNLVPIVGSILTAGAAVGAVLVFHRWPEAPSLTMTMHPAQPAMSAPVATPG